MIALFLFLLFAFLCWKKRISSFNRFELLFAFGVKLLFSFGYFYYYVYVVGNGQLEAGNHSVLLVNGDFYTFFGEAKELHDVFYTSPTDFFKLFFGLDDSLAPKYLEYTEHWTHLKPGIMNDSQNVMRVNALIYFIGGGSLVVHFILVNAVVLFSTVYFVNSFEKRTTFSKRFVFWLLLLIPSFAFSNASIIKEPFLFSGILLMLGAVFNSNKKAIFQWQFYVGILLMVMFKAYVLLFFVPLAALYLVSRAIKIRLIYFVISSFLVVSSVLFFSVKTRNLVTQTISDKQYDFMNVGRGGVHLLRQDSLFYVSESLKKLITFKNEFFVEVPKNLRANYVQSGSIYPFENYVFKQTDSSVAIFYINPRANSFFESTPIQRSFSNLVKTAPEAFFRAAICPTFMDVGGWKMKIHFIETLFLYGFIFYSFIRNRKSATQTDRSLQFILIGSAVLLFLLIGWTTPVFGAIVRYRLPAILFLLIASMLCAVPKTKSEER